ncbi:MAG: hypothetical protein HUJ25_06175 [Crocinitomicaceae bacterium]|nr:hypothetical protein [Crocinitomicaceae bacterium]
MRELLIIILVVGGFGSLGYGQLYFPNEQYYNNEIDRIFLSDSANKTFFNAHLSLRPILDKRSNPDSVYYKDSKHYYWITQKIFKENFLIFEGDGFWCAVDPVLDLEGGTDFSADSLDMLYWNTRGIRVQAKFLDKVAFSTVVYENQAMVPQYVSEYVDAHGEFRPSGTNYKQQNAVFPGYARTKAFKTTGYDFAFAEGQVSIVPNKYFNVQFGNGNHFIGNGYRSLLLSDFSLNYPFAKFEGNLWKGRIQYNAIYAIHQNLYRMPYYNSVESTYERKLGTYHYLDFAVTPSLQIGLFEGALWKRSDSLGSVEPNWLFLNPVPFVNAGIMSNETSGYNHILGVNVSWTFLKNRLYAQAVIDNKTLGAAQLGIRTMDLFTPKLDVQVEFNHASSNTYLAQEKRYNYSHGNLPLAHPLTTRFTEGMLQINYEIKEVFFTNRLLISERQLNDTLYNGISILNDEIGSISLIGETQQVLVNQLELGYRFNKNYNLQAVIGWLYRNEQNPGSRNITNYVYAGIRTRLRNKTLDF